MTTDLETRLTPAQLAVWSGLNSPFDVQTYLDGIAYSLDKFNRCPLRVLQDNTANCFDGALFAAAALRRLGYPPITMDLLVVPGSDDDHTVAIYRCDGFLGAVAKSNFSTLRFREPIYRSPRELALSYFEFYFNINGVKTLREYTRPFNLTTCDDLGWMWSDEALDTVIERMIRQRRYPLITARMAAALSPMDRRSYEAGSLGTDLAGVYVPESEGPSGL